MHMEFWYWWVLGLGLLALEIFAPGAFFLWLGVAAGITGAILWFIPSMSLESQLFVFGVLSVATIVLSRTVLHKRKSTPTDQPLLNQRSAQYIGRVFTLTSPIVNGQGTVTVDDSRWNVRGPDTAAGQQIVVTAVDGVILLVEPKN